MKPSIDNFWNPIPRKYKKLVWAVKAFCGSVGAGSIVADYKWLGLTVLLLGALCDGFVELLKDDNE
jgi:hypothetical protein